MELDKFRQMTGRDAVVIADTAQESTAADLGNKTLTAVQIPAGMTGTALTFEASDLLAGTYVPVKKADGSAYSIVIGSDASLHAVDYMQFLGSRFIKVKSGTAESGPKTVTVISALMINKQH